MVLRLRQHNIGYTADGFYRSDDPTNNVTVPFTLVYAGKCATKDQSKTDTLQKLSTTQKKQKT